MLTIVRERFLVEQNALWETPTGSAGSTVFEKSAIAASWLADLGPTVDPHPCVLLSRDVAMRRRRRAIVAIITSNAHGTRVEVSAGPDDGLDYVSVIDADDLVTLDTELLIQRLGALSPSKLAVLAEALRIALSLPRFEQLRT